MNETDTSEIMNTRAPGYAVQIHAFWQRTARSSHLWTTGPTGAEIRVAWVIEGAQGAGWRWHAAGTTGATKQLGDAERLATLRLPYKDHEAWMEHVHASGYEWANVSSMERTNPIT